MSYYVSRVRFYPYRIGWTEPIRSPRQAEKERQAWQDAGWIATVVPSTPQVRKEIRAWEKSKA